MKSIRDILLLSQEHLESKQVPSPRRRVEELLCHVLKLPRVELYLQHERPLEADELQQCRAGLKRLANREPWQHLVGEVPFLDCNIRVTPDVLIPRHETEWIADRVCSAIESSGIASPVVWDICTGSGCLALAIKQRVPSARVVGCDISAKALAVAKENGRRNGLEVEWVEGDLMEPLSGSVDFIVSNPPYISESEYQELEPEVRAYEPKLALVGGEDGLRVYQALAEQVRQLENRPRAVWLEIGKDQGSAVKKIFSEQGMDGGRVECDLSGHPRLFFLESL